ncbi:MAG TPA: PDZ domain-containing protein [Thermoanaerobaculia bacterium]|nr:PDZ domain-containing protein [Thermoanaerobaculia bacterium]
MNSTLAMIILAAVATVPAGGAEPLRRRADLGFAAGRFTPGEGLMVARVAPGTAAARAGLLAGDRLLGIGARTFTTGLDADAGMAALRSGERVTLRLTRGGVALALPVVLEAMPLDDMPEVEFSYEEIRNPRSGERQRVIVSRPRGTATRLPAVFFIPWLSCDSVEAAPGARGGIETLLYRIASESGLVLMRVEKPGVGDSEGVCSETDLDTELAGNRAAFEALKRHPWVDPARVVAMGQSFAGGLLPLVAPREETHGYLFLNSWVRTWLERLLEFERRRLEAAGLSAGDVSTRMRRLAELYGLVLEGGLTPAEASRRKPELGPVWEDAPAHQYGRPIRFLQQLQATNVSAAWEKVDRPTLAVFGEADLVMSRSDHERVVALVNRNRPGAARLLTVPGMDHGLSAPLPGGGEGLPEVVATTVLNWLRRVAGSP